MALAVITAKAQLPTQDFGQKRCMWASVNTISNASLGDYQTHTGKLLISWRMLPTDTWDTSFYLYRRIASNINGMYQRTSPATALTTTCYQMSVPTAAYVYYLVDAKYFGGGTAKSTITNNDEKRALREAALDSITITADFIKDKLPYISIPLKTTEDVCDVDVIKYQANDATVADLDGDGEMEIVVKRLLSVYDAEGNCISDGTGAGNSDTRARHCVIWDAYKLDGTFLWRIKSGPNIILGNSSNFAVADLDGDGCAEFVTKTGEGTVFGDGKEIGDTDNDGRTDYRSIWPAGHYTGDGPNGYGGPEFFSVVDGKTGKELARANFIARGPEGQTPAQWAANWEANDWKWDPRTKKYTWKLANSLRLGVASFKGKGLQIFMGRGVYGRTIVEAWEYAPQPSGEYAGTLTRMWKIDTEDAGGEDKNKDGKPYSAYAGQGNHAFNVADLDGDGKDEVMYGSCAWDDDGTGLWSTGLGHGDANHVGRFLPDREGMQVYHCLENGTTMVALHDAKDGSVIWKQEGSSTNDTGRCLVADIDPNSSGCEFWWAGSNAYSQSGSTDLGYKPGSCNMAIWFDGGLTRQLINENIINNDRAGGRTFTIYRYNETFINGTKSNPCWYGDFLGDWREEVILPSNDKLTDLKVFSTWYPTTYKLPYLMSDHTYFMQCIHEQVGYNQPTNVGGYYLGNGMDFTKVPLKEDPSTTGVKEVKTPQQQDSKETKVYDLSGRAVQQPRAGLYVRNGKKFVVR
jgi:rhamnogalacturonan endolyase